MAKDCDMTGTPACSVSNAGQRGGWHGLDTAASRPDVQDPVFVGRLLSAGPGTSSPGTARFDPRVPIRIALAAPDEADAVHA